MNTFAYRQQELCCEDVPLRRLAEKFGTPLYVYSRNHIVGQYQALDHAFGKLDHRVCYAVKANSNLAILAALTNTQAQLLAGIAALTPTSGNLIVGTGTAWASETQVQAIGATAAMMALIYG